MNTSPDSNKANMKNERTLMIATVLGVVGACHAATPTPQPAQSADRTVFTDSTLHTELCAPLQSGEDWRKVCTPKDQRIDLRKPQPSRQPPRVP
jgi:hypothetical protein